MNLDQARFFMVEQQIRPWDVLDPKILDLFMDTPRHQFVTKDNEKLAYSDIELPLDHNQAMMSPKVEARLLQALDISSSDTVLEIGTGSGFLTALIAKSAKAVTSVELFDDIQATARERLTAYSNIDFQSGDASADWNDGKTYDAIIIGASTAKLPQAYKEKLTLGGRIAFIEGQSPAMSAKLVTRISQQEWEEETLFETDLASLINAETKSEFKF